MGSSCSTFTVNHGRPMRWKTSAPWISRWSDRSDDIIETCFATDGAHREHALFQLQTSDSGGSVRIVVRDFVSSTQITVIEANSIDRARLGYQFLVHMVLGSDDFEKPETVKSALERCQTLPGAQLQNLINSDDNRFRDPLLQPFDLRWNPADFEADIILVHGIGGDPLKTWINQEGFWPVVWLLDSQIGIRSILHQYNINDLPPTNKIRVLTIPHGAAMLNIDNESDPTYIVRCLFGPLLHAGVGSKPIIWLAHSLGGLMVKEVLYLASQNTLWRDITSSTKGVIFLGTPHCGAPWASVARQCIPMPNSPGLKYLDPAPSIGAHSGNAHNLQVWNEFFSQNTIPFLNFSEGTICSVPLLSFLSPFKNCIIVPDAQAQIIGCICVDPASLAEQMSIGILPQRVHFPCLDCHHENIAKPLDRDHPTYHFTKIYVANWLQRRAIVVNHTERVNWDKFARSIVNTVRMYALVIDRITDEDTIRQLRNVSTAISLALERVTIKEFLILLVIVSSALITTGSAGIVAGAAVGGPIGAVAALGVIVATASIGGDLVMRLDPRVRELLTNNVASIRQMVNLLSGYVMPDFENTLSNAPSEQELNATLNYLRRTAARTICCVYLESASAPDVIFRDSHAIQAAVIRHDSRIRQAEIVVAHLSHVMGGITTINSDDAEARARVILTQAFIDQALHGTRPNFQ